MAETIDIGIRINADGRELVGAARISREELSRLRQELNRVDDATRQAEEGSNQFTAALGSMRGMLAGITAGAILAGADSLAQYAKEVNNTALRLGVSTEALQEWAHVVEKAGSDMDTLSDVLLEQGLRAAEAAVGTGEAIDAYNALGISAQKLIQLRPDQQFALMVEALRGVANASTRAMLADQLWGDAGTNLLGVINQNSEAINRQKQEAHELGLVMSGEALDSTVKARSGFSQLTRGLKGLALSVLTELSPSLIWLASFLSEKVPVSVRVGISVFRILANTFSFVRGKVAALGGVLFGFLGKLPGFLGGEQFEEWGEGFTQSAAEISKEVGATTEEIKKYNQETREMIEGSKAQENATKEQTEATRKQAEALEDVKLAQGETNAVVDKAAEAAREQAEAQREANKARQEAEKLAREQARAEASLARELDNLARGLVDTYDKTRRMEEAQILLTQAVQAGNITVIEAEFLTRKLAKSLEDTGKKAEEASDSAQEVFIRMPNLAQSAADGIQRAFSDTFEDIFRNGFDGFSGFFDSLKGLFFRLLSQMLGAWASSGLMQLLRGGTAASSGANAFGGGFGMPGGGSGMFGGLTSSIDKFGMGLGFGPGADFVGPVQPGGLASFSSVLGAAGAGAVGGGLVGGFFGGKGQIGGSIGGALGAGLATAFGASLTPVLGPFGPLVGGLIGSVLGGFVGSLFGGIEGELKLKTSEIAKDFEHKNKAFGQSAFGFSGIDTQSHDLEEISKGLTDRLTQQVVAFDQFVASFLDDAQIKAVGEALRTTEAITVDVGKNLHENELGQALADRAITILTALDLAVPEIIKEAVESESHNPQEVKDALFKALLTGTTDLNPKLDELILNFTGTGAKLQQFAQTVVAINAMLPGLNAVFGAQDPEDFVKAAQDFGGIQNFTAAVNAFSEFMGYTGEVAKANMETLRKNMEKELADVGATRENFKKQFEAAREAGLSPEELKEWVEAGLAIKSVTDAVAELNDFIGGFQDEFDRMNMSDFQYGMKQLGESFDAAMKKAIALGATTEDLILIEAVYQQKRQEMIAGLENSIRSLVDQLFIRPELERVNKEIAEAREMTKGGSQEAALIGRHRLERLEKEKADLEARLQKSEDITLAQNLSQQIADLAQARDISFGQIAAEFGFSLEDLAEKMNMTPTELKDYLKDLQETNYTLPDLVTSFSEMLGPYFDDLKGALDGKDLSADMQQEVKSGEKGASSTPEKNTDKTLNEILPGFSESMGKAAQTYQAAADKIDSASGRLKTAIENYKTATDKLKVSADTLDSAANTFNQAVNTPQSISVNLEEAAVGPY